MSAPEEVTINVSILQETVFTPRVTTLVVTDANVMAASAALSSPKLSDMFLPSVGKDWATILSPRAATTSGKLPRSTSSSAIVSPRTDGLSRSMSAAAVLTPRKEGLPRTSSTTTHRSRGLSDVSALKTPPSQTGAINAIDVVGAINTIDVANANAAATPRGSILKRLSNIVCGNTVDMATSASTSMPSMGAVDDDSTLSGNAGSAIGFVETPSSSPVIPAVLKVPVWRHKQKIFYHHIDAHEFYLRREPKKANSGASDTPIAETRSRRIYYMTILGAESNDVAGVTSYGRHTMELLSEIDEISYEMLDARIGRRGVAEFKSYADCLSKLGDIIVIKFELNDVTEIEYMWFDPRPQREV
jgi:hypothetical protein